MENIIVYVQTLWNNIINLQVSDFLISSNQVKTILLAHICWWAIYGFIHFFIDVKHKTKKQTVDTKTRIVSIIHAIYASLLSFYDFVYYQSDKCGQNNNDLQNFILCTSLAYFAYDTICCILLDVSDTEMVVHHICVMLGYYTGISFNHSASEMLRALLLADLSNPIMHTRLIVRNYGLKHTKLYLYMDLIYMFIYILARTILGFMTTYFTVFCMNNLFIVKVSGLGVWLQSVIFIRRMIAHLYMRYFEMMERKRKNIYYFWFEVNKKIEELDYYKIAATKHKDKYVP